MNDIETANDSDHVRSVKRLYLALKSKDIASIKSLLANEPTWDVSPGFPEGGLYKGMQEVFGRFYPRLLSRVYSFGAFPEVFVGHGNTVVALGHYQVVASQGNAPVHVRFAHAWKIGDDGRIEGVYQVADSGSFPAR